jgi:serine/threonine-protein kinase
MRRVSTLALDIGQTVAGYEILSLLGKGGMGRVYRVQNVVSGRIEAMKVLLADVDPDSDMVERFESEIRTLARLDHPNIAKLNTAVRVGDELLMLMEFVEGRTLADFVPGSLTIEELLSYAGQTLTALNYAHQNYVIHRDIKPTNIMVTPQGLVKLMDFGIAKTRDDQVRTKTGFAVGSVVYMSPEQVLGTPVDARSDLYSMGLVLYELSVGRRAFNFESTYSVFDAQLNSMPPPPIEVNPGIPQALSDIILKAIEKDPRLRFQSASEFRRCLEEVSGAPELVRGASAGGSSSAPRRVVAPFIPPTEVSKTSAASSEQAAPAVLTDKQPAHKPSARKWVAIASLILVAAAVALFAFHFFGSRPKPSATVELPSVLNLATGDMVLVKGGEAFIGELKHPKRMNSFYIDSTEVSMGAYRQFCKERSKQLPRETEQLSSDMPAVNVTFYDAMEFAAWAHKRLPSADEWEVAARGLSGLDFPWGNQFARSLANLKLSEIGHTMPVYSYANGKSPAGALNTVGNVWELVGTECEAPRGKEFEDYQKKEFSYLIPPLSSHEPFFQARGGSYLTNLTGDEVKALVWDDMPFPARARKPDVGFRCARSADH